MSGEVNRLSRMEQHGVEPIIRHGSGLGLNAIIITGSSNLSGAWFTSSLKIKPNAISTGLLRTLSQGEIIMGVG